MSNQRIIPFTLVPLTALALVTALVFLTAGPSTPVQAADTTPDWQQMNGHMPMTGTMTVTDTMPAMMNRMMQQMQTMMGQDMELMGAMPMMTSTMSMPGAMPMHQPGMGANMVMMGRRMQMTGMMMQMMGHMQEMMVVDMPMRHGAMLVTGTMPMSNSMGMMGMDMGAMQAQMGQMMKMMAAMQEMMGIMPGAMHAGASVTNTTSLSGTTNALLSALTQTVQVGTVEIKVTPLNLQDTEAATLDFAIELNSHSQEIDIDLAKTASLTSADNAVNPAAWETATPKGHHIQGVLQFSRMAEDGSAHLADATEISLVIGGLPGDAERTFTWEVNSQ